MKLKEAKDEFADIVCANEGEKSEVIRILKENGHELEKDVDGGLTIALYRIGNYYTISALCSDFYPQIPASDFIASNPIPDQPTPVYGC